MKLRFKTPHDDVIITYPTLRSGYTINQMAGVVYFHTAVDFINGALDLLDLYSGDATFSVGNNLDYYNEEAQELLQPFNILDIGNLDDSWFESDWECNDLRIHWGKSSVSGGYVINGYYRKYDSSTDIQRAFWCYQYTSGSAHSTTMFAPIFYCEEYNRFIVGGQTYSNMFRMDTNYTTDYNYRLYVDRNLTADSSSSINFTMYALSNTSGGGGGIEPDTPTPGDDPYSPGGYSGSGGGPAPTGGTGTTGNGGLHDDTSDAISTPSTPSDVVVSSGIFTAYNPSASQLASFASALWNMQVSDINDVLRFLFGGDAFNAIIGLHLLPVAPSTGSSSSIKLGNWDTGVSAPKITSQYAQVSFGSVLLPEYWGNCIDYAPYTRVQLALPYIGMVDVDTDDVLGSTNTLTYNIDVLSGALCAMLHCVKGNLTSVIYQWSGSCAVDLPITGANKNAIIGAIGASGVVTSMAFSAAGGGLLGGLAASAALAGSAASAYGTAKGKVQKNGNFGSHAGALGIMTPYFIVSRPVQSVPTTWQADKGYPANISAQLGTVTGYTEVSEINLECSGTEAEKKEIIDLLKKGVIF